MWSKAVNILESVKNFASDETNPVYETDLIEMIGANRQTLFNLFRGGGKSTTHRVLLDKIGEIVTLENGQSIRIDEEIRTESLAILDAFNCDEIDALELIIAGETQMNHFVPLTRGLCAVICYYDAQRCLSAAIKMLIHLNYPVDKALSSSLSSILHHFCTDFSVANRLIEVLHTVNVHHEFYKLYQPSINGLGGPKHQQILRELIEEALMNCSSALFSLCAWWRESSVPTFLSSLFIPLKCLSASIQFSNQHFSLWNALLILLSPNTLSQSSCAKQLLIAFERELKMEEWSDVCLCASLQFAFVLGHNWLVVNQSTCHILDGFSIDVNDLLEKSIKGLAFQFIRKCVIPLLKEQDNSIAFEMVDALLKQMIAHFPEKLWILSRVCEEELVFAEDVLVQGQLYRPNLHFEVFLRCIADLYDIECPKRIELSSQFCCGENRELINFIKRKDELISPILHVAYLDMVKNLCLCKSSAKFVFELLLDRDSRGGGALLCWNHFWKAMDEYLRLFNKRKGQKSKIIPSIESRIEYTAEISQSEMAGLLAWTQLAEAISKNDSHARRRFIDYDVWHCIETVVGLVCSEIQLALKGALFRFLSSLAVDGIGVPKIWLSLISHSVLATNASGKLMGIQQELDERECSVKRFYSSLGLMHLLKEMFLHTEVVIDKQHFLPYLDFIIRSIISQCAQRSYEEIDQMWELYATSCDALYNSIDYYLVTSTSLVNEHPQIHVLRLLFNESSFLHALGNVLIDCVDQLSSFSARNKMRERAALSVLRLFDTCVSKYENLIDAIRSTESNMMINSLDSLFLRPIPERPITGYLTVISSFIIYFDILPYHCYRALSILHKICRIRASHQQRIVRVLSPLTQKLVESCAQIISTGSFPLSISALDLLSPQEIEALPIDRIRGETTLLLLEVFVTAVDFAPSTPNIAYLLCGFDLNNLAKASIQSPGETGYSRNCFHSIIDTLNILATHGDPLNLSYCGIFEPELRLLLKMVSVEAICASAVLRFLRSNHEIICRLLQSQFFLSPIPNEDDPDSRVLGNLQRMLQGSILHLGAIELSTLLKSGHFSQPEKIYRAMLGGFGANAEDKSDRGTPEIHYFDYCTEEGVEPLLWRIVKEIRLDNSIIEPLKLELLDAKRMGKLLTLCTRPIACNIDQCDVKHLGWLMRQESLFVAADMRPEYLDIVSKEIEKVLEYCASFNLRKSSEASARLLISAWLSFINVIAILAPVPFIAFDVQIRILIDSVNLLIHCGASFDLDVKLSSAVSYCLSRITSSICHIFRCMDCQREVVDKDVTNTLDLIIHYLTTPGQQSVQSKVDLYSSIANAIEFLTEYHGTMENIGRKSCLRMEENIFGKLDLKQSSGNLIRACINKRGEELVKKLSNDLVQSPYNLKITAISCLTQVLNRGSVDLVGYFARTGALRQLIDLMPSITMEGTSDAHVVRMLLLLKAITTLFIQLSLSEVGWTFLSEMNVLNKLKSLVVWKNPPRELFIPSKVRTQFEETSDTGESESKGNKISDLYLDCVNNVIHYCLSCCAHPQWKRISQEVLEVINGQTELINHFVRFKLHGDIIALCSALVSYIFNHDQRMQVYIKQSFGLSRLNSVAVKCEGMNETLLIDKKCDVNV